MPCCDVIAVLISNKSPYTDSLEDRAQFTHPAYFTSTLKDMYKEPLRVPETRELVMNDEVRAARARRQAGRPQKARIASDAGSGGVSAGRLLRTCARCGVKGHFAITCQEFEEGLL